MRLIGKSVLLKLFKPNLNSHKGDNGRILIIAGSKKYHGALLLAIQAASRIVDIVYVHSAKENSALIKKLKSQTAVFISVFPKELWQTVEIVDAVLIGPGLGENQENKKTAEQLLKKYQQKKTFVDATALWHLNPKLLHKNCVATPHSREFKKLFNSAPNKENVLKMAKKYNCFVVLKGRYDYVSDGKQLFENRTGNVGMTKGGTGDVLAGLITALAAKNNLLLAAQAGVYLNGLAGDKLYKKSGTFYNAEDVVNATKGVIRKYVANH